MNYKIINKRDKKRAALGASTFCVVLFMLFSSLSSAQVTSQVDTTSIRIGEQISYKINVEADSSAMVVFPEGQTFLPLEAVEASEIDSLRRESKFLLSRIYKLTQFDSGRYTIPKQKVLVGDNIFFTDSLIVRVNTIEVDTTKQKLFDVKPIIDVDKSISNWWKWLLIIVLVLGLTAFLVYWFIWRKKPLTEEEEIALLPPYDRAKLSLTKLDENQYLRRGEIKAFYSDLTLALRKFLDEKVYDRALESTSAELISRLQLLKDGNQFPFTKETLSNIETIFKRADLVKFAKSAPDIALAEMDKNTIAKEIDNVKACLPEPTEEEKLLNQQYKEEQERKKKRKKVILSGVVGLVAILATYIGFGIAYGFGYVNDTIVGNKNKDLLEGNWVESAYGFPPIWIETPEVLRRMDSVAAAEINENMKTTMFVYGGLNEDFYIRTGTSQVIKAQAETADEQKAINMTAVVEANLKKWEEKGVRNIITKTEQFITPNAAEGLKTFGTAQFPTDKSDEFENGEYAIYSFTTENVVQQIVIVWRTYDDYADSIVERITNSIELVPDEVAQEGD